MLPKILMILKKAIKIEVASITFLTKKSVGTYVYLPRSAARGAPKVEMFKMQFGLADGPFLPNEFECMKTVWPFIKISD